MHLSLTIEDTNKLRARLGLELIPTKPNNSLEPPRICAERNFASIEHKEINLTGNKESVKNKHFQTTDSWLNIISTLKQPKLDNVSSLKNDEMKPSNPSKDVVLPQQKRQKPPDPLDTSNGYKIENKIKQKTAVFKAKKIRLNSSKRGEKAKSKVNHSELSYSDQDYYKMLLSSSRKCTPAISHSKSGYAAMLAPSFKMANTPEFLKKMKNIGADETKIAHTDDKIIITPLPLEEGTLKHRDETSTTSVAETLQILRMQKERDDTSLSVPNNSNSRKWAKKLLALNDRRTRERIEFEEKLKNLPLKERNTAVSLFNQRINNELKKDAKIITENYEPNVYVQHHDTYGNTITPRQAFKKLSKTFHDNQIKNKK